LTEWTISKLKMDFFKRISDLATFIDNELHQIEASFQVLMNSGRKYDGPAEISLEIQGEIQDLSKQLDQLIRTGEDQAEHFDGFLKGMIDTIAEFDEKIERIEKYAANYGYVIRNKEKTDLRTSLQQIEEPNQIEETVDCKLAPVSRKISSPNILELGLVSKTTLQNLGITLRGAEKEVCNEAIEEVEEEVVQSEEEIHENQSPILSQEEDDSLIEESPVFSILKKPNAFKNKKLDASIANYSKIEISPGLFVKRPSSKTKMQPPPLAAKSDQQPEQVVVENNILPKEVVESVQKTAKSDKNDVLEEVIAGSDSPQMPKLKTIDLKQIMKEKQTTACAGEENDVIVTPELPLFQSEEGKFLSTKKNNPINKLMESKKGEEKEEIVTPEMPIFQSEEGKFLSTKKINPNNKLIESRQDEEKEDIVTPELPIFQSEEGKFLSTKKINSHAPSDIINKENLVDSPEMPALKTINLKSVIQQAKGTYL